MSKKTIAVIFGGESSEHEISRLSSKNIINAISSEKYFIMPLYIAKNGAWYIYEGDPASIGNTDIEKFGTPVIFSSNRDYKGVLRLVGNQFKLINVDIAFAVLHGKNGEDGVIQGLFEMAKIPYVGSGVLSSAVCMDKSIMKLIANGEGIPQAKYAVLRKGENYSKNAVGYPCFVKPANAGSSIGISYATNRAELNAAIKLAFEYDSKIIVEEAIKGRELEVGILGQGDNIISSGVGEVVYDDVFYSYDAKYNSSSSNTIVNADVSDEVKKQVKTLAEKIYKACDCKGLARVDFFLNQSGKVIFNEINTMPGFTAISMFSMLWQEAGVPIDELVAKLIENE